MSATSARDDHANAILSICLKRNIRYSTELVHSYAQWKNTVEFPSYTTLYQKVSRFIEERVLEKGIPIFAKTMTGELIPLIYRPECDKRDLLKQLEEIDSDRFPMGSTNIFRLVADTRQPVEEEEIFALVQHNSTTVKYAPLQSGDEPNVSAKYGTSICYRFTINCDGFVQPNEVDRDLTVTIYHFFEQDLFMNNYSPEKYSMDQISELPCEIYYYTPRKLYYLTESTQNELITLINIVLHDHLVK